MSNPNFYKLTFKTYKEKIDDIDPIYYQTQNDLEDFDIPIRDRCRYITPSNDSYHDYYYEYMGMTKKLTLHDSFVNDCSMCGPRLCGQNKCKNRHQINYGVAKKRLLSNLNMPDQPVFNEKFLNKVSKQGYLAVYSKHK